MGMFEVSVDKHSPFVDLCESKSSRIYVPHGIFLKYRHRSMGRSDHLQDASQLARTTRHEQLDAELWSRLRNMSRRIHGLLSGT